MDLFSCLSPFSLCSLSSGSDCNAYYIENQHDAILVDVGIPVSTIESRLREIGASMSQVKAILLTHDHIDHVRGLVPLTRKYPIPVYGHCECLDALQEEKSTSDIDLSLLRPIASFGIVTIAGIEIEAFPVSHDAHGSMGYYFNVEGRSLTIATDLGVIDMVTKDYLLRSDSIIIEANYDEMMLKKGSYPFPLKRRIHSPFGHLSNEETARFVAENYRQEMKNILFCHLSDNNNDPELLMQMVRRHFRYNGIVPDPSTTIIPLPRTTRSERIFL